MKDRPIIFSELMIRALLEGRKTQTRRLVQRQDSLDWLASAGDDRNDPQNWGWRRDGNGWDEFLYLSHPAHQREAYVVNCPYGKPGDRLWVRESWSVAGSPGIWPCPAEFILYRSGYPKNVHRRFENIPDESDVRWKSPIFMPRWASRIKLGITGVRVERLQNISEDDARSEGGPNVLGFNDGKNKFGFMTYREWYTKLWQDIHGDGSWAINPWVWVVSFKRIDFPKSEAA